MTSPRRRRAQRSRSQRISMGTGDLCACFWLNLSRRSGCSHCAESTARSTGRSAAREMSVSPGRLGFGPCVGWLNGTAGVDRRDEGAFGSGSVRGRIDKCRYIRSLYLIRHARERVHKENPWMSDRIFGVPGPGRRQWSPWLRVHSCTRNGCSCAVSSRLESVVLRFRVQNASRFTSPTLATVNLKKYPRRQLRVG